MKKMLMYTALLGSQGFVQARQAYAAQDSSKTRFQVYVQRGLGTFYRPQVQPSVYGLLSPSWTPIRSGNYTEVRWANYATSAQYSWSAGLNIDPKDKHDNRLSRAASFQIGLSYLSAALVANSVEAFRHVTYDTLFDLNNNPDRLYDSLFQHTQYLSCWSQEMRLDAAVMFRSSQKRRVSFFAGLGLSGGYSLSVYTLYWTDEDIQTSDRDLGQKPDYSRLRAWGPEEYFWSRNRGFFVWAAQLPLGIDFRLSGKHKFLSRTHLYLEYRPTVNVRYTKESGTLVHRGTMRSLGLRVSL